MGTSFPPPENGSGGCTATGLVTGIVTDAASPTTALNGVTVCNALNDSGVNLPTNVQEVRFCDTSGSHGTAGMYSISLPPIKGNRYLDHWAELPDYKPFADTFLQGCGTTTTQNIQLQHR